MSPPRPSRVEAVALILAAVELGVAAAVLRWGPPRIATHFGLDGAPDRWSTPTQAATGVAALATVVLAMTAGLGLAVRRPWADLSRRRGLGVAQGLLAGVGAAVVALLAASALDGLGGSGPEVGPSAGLSLLLVGIGLFLGRVAPNSLIGVRTPWSLSSRLAWDRSNRLAGRLFLAAGLAGLVAALVLPAGAGVVPVGGALLAGLLAALESWRVWRADPRRQPI